MRHGPQYRSTPTRTVGRLTNRLPVPACLDIGPEAKTRVGIINSPPATPRRLLPAQWRAHTGPLRRRATGAWPEAIPVLRQHSLDNQGDADAHQWMRMTRSSRASRAPGERRPRKAVMMAL